MSYRTHVFVCVTERPPFARPSCGGRGARALVDALGAELEARDLTGQIGLTATECLGPCESGPTIVVYPQGIWYRGVTPADIPELVQTQLVDGLPVERLRSLPPSG